MLRISYRLPWISYNLTSHTKLITAFLANNNNWRQFDNNLQLKNLNIIHSILEPEPELVHNNFADLLFSIIHERHLKLRFDPIVKNVVLDKQNFKQSILSLKINKTIKRFIRIIWINIKWRVFSRNRALWIR